MIEYGNVDLFARSELSVAVTAIEFTTVDDKPVIAIVHTFAAPLVPAKV